ncbi:MAG: CHASE2 and HATPase_c domain-containing protein [Thermoanaerobaculales bacterium]|nr:CHASE2 and HATPase_c domain-containing protein [Thermoanaerobaculales bacterium]
MHVATARPTPEPGTLRLAALLAAAAGAVTAGLWLAGWLPGVERVGSDLLLRATVGGRGGAVPVAAVLIDDRALARLGPLPWPRARIAELVDAVADAGAAAIAVDVLLAGPTAPEDDRRLGAAIARLPAVLAAALDRDGAWLLPPPSVSGAAVVAHAYGEVGPDGVVRTIAATKQAGDLALPALALAAARLLEPRLAVAPGTALRPAFRPAPQALPTLGAAEVLAGARPADALRGRLVFVGIAATGAGDQFVVPTGPRRAPAPGVLAHASAAASILGGRLLRVPHPIWTAAACLVLAFGVQLLRSRAGAFDLARFAALLAGLLLLAGAAARWGLVLLPVATLAVAMVASALLRETLESRLARREISSLLGSLLAHLGDRTAAAPPRTARARLAALKRLQRRVLEEDAARRALLDGMAEGVVLWAPDGALLEANPAARRLWGGVPTPGELDAAAGSGEAVIARGARELAVRSSELGSGRLALLRDATAERALERQRREMQRLVSHELRTPLASIAGLGETLERYPLTGDELARVAALIRGEAQRLSEMVGLFLDLERLGGGHWESAAERLDLRQLVAARLDLLEAAAASRGITLARDLAGQCRIDGSAVLFERVVDNLVGNAIRHTHAGDTVEVGLRSEAGRVRLAVRDHGPGIPEHAQGRIFERFFRVPGAGSPGAGLGLALVKEVVTWHGGCVGVESRVGAGAVFTVELPAAAEE